LKFYRSTSLLAQGILPRTGHIHRNKACPAFFTKLLVNSVYQYMVTEAELEP